MKPAKGLMKGDLQIFVVKVNPPEVRTYKQKLTMRLNDNNKYDQVRVSYQYNPPPLPPKEKQTKNRSIEYVYISLDGS